MITLKNINKTYHNDSFALQSVNVTVEQGEIFGIIGRSGAGKSTLVRCINLLERPTSGEVIIDRVDVTELSGKALRQQRQKLGMVFQHFNLLASRTALENVLLALEIAGWDKKKAHARALELLDLVGLNDQKSLYPDQLSGGQKQRVGIARALGNDPKVLLCDEATSALDPETTVSILNLLKEINQKLKLTIVLITHEMEVIKSIAHRVGILEKGELVEVAKVIDVFSRPKAQATQELIRASLHLEIPTKLQERLHQRPAKGRVPLVRFAFVGDEQVQQPLLAQLAEKFDVDANIFQATMEWIGETPFGVTLCELLGSDEAIKAALTFVEQQHIQYEVRGYVTVHAISAA